MSCPDTHPVGSQPGPQDTTSDLPPDLRSRDPDLQTRDPDHGPDLRRSGPQTPRADPSDPLLHLGSGEPSRVSVDQSGTREVLKLTAPLEALLGYPVRPPFPGLAASKWYTRKGPKTLNLQILRVPSEGSQTPRF